jgi:hypothetical protein
MQKSESICALSKALVQAIAVMENAPNNPAFKSNYANLESVLAVTKPTLEKHGLAITQFPVFANGVPGVETIVIHESGEWISATGYSPTIKQDPQAVGSAITYLRRYSLAAVCGLTQEDDDGNAASKKPETHSPTLEDYNTLLAEAAKKKGVEFLSYLSIKDIPPIQKKWADEYMGK